MVEQKRKFGSPGLTHSATHHLMAVDTLIDRHGYARVSDIARELDLTRGSVSVAMQSLRVPGYVEQDENHFYHLTDLGRTAIASVRLRHEIVEEFLTGVLGLSTEAAHRESCRMEYLLEAPTAKRLAALMDYWQDKELGKGFARRIKKLGTCSDCDQAESGKCPCCALECLEDEALCPVVTAAGK
jgi:Mn-dependent DtxR family transcriptional regulator